MLSSGGPEACILPLDIFSAIFPVEFWTDRFPQGGGGGLDTRVHQRRAVNSFRGCGGMYLLIQCIAFG